MMTRDELLDWAIASGRALPAQREAWANAYDRDPAGTEAQLRAVGPIMAQPTGRLAEIARDQLGSI